MNPSVSVVMKEKMIPLRIFNRHRNLSINTKDCRISSFDEEHSWSVRTNHPGLNSVVVSSIISPMSEPSWRLKKKNFCL